MWNVNRKGERSISESVRTLRWIILGGIFVVVIADQCMSQYVFDFGSTTRVIIGIFVYAFFGSLVTWAALTWVSNRIGAGEKAEIDIFQHLLLAVEFVQPQHGKYVLLTHYKHFPLFELAPNEVSDEMIRITPEVMVEKKSEFDGNVNN